MMKRIFLLMILAMALPAFAAAEDWSNVSIVDTQCSAKVKADPDSHTRDCALSLRQERLRHSRQRRELPQVRRQGKRRKR